MPKPLLDYHTAGLLHLATHDTPWQRVGHIDLPDGKVLPVYLHDLNIEGLVLSGEVKLTDEFMVTQQDLLPKLEG